MTFSDAEIEKVAVDLSDEYYPVYDGGETLTVKITGLEDFFCRAFRIDLEYYTNGWVNILVEIDPTEERATTLYFESELNEEKDKDRVLWISLKYAEEGRAFYRQLLKTDPDLEDFVKQCKEEKEEMAA